MKIIIGLGNPGKQYENTRHNVGFNTIFNICNTLKLTLDNEMFNGSFVRTKINGEDVIFAIPLTYMNLSGDFVQKILHYFKINVEDLLVIFDDFDTPIGSIKLKPKGSSGGQNGMKDIINKLGTEDIKRIKIGIGKPKSDKKNFVLSKFNGQDQTLVHQAIIKASQAAYDFIFEPFDKIMNKYNQH